jgi:hypothetical protein
MFDITTGLNGAEKVVNTMRDKLKDEILPDGIVVIP